MRYQRFRTHRLAVCAASVLCSLPAYAQPDATAVKIDEATIRVSWSGFFQQPPPCRRITLSRSVGGQPYTLVGQFQGNSHTLSSLPAGTYQFSVEGCIDVFPWETTAFTPPVTLAGISTPATPANIDVVAGASPDDFTVQWSSVAGVDRYEIRQRFFDGATWTDYSTWASNSTNLQFHLFDQEPGAYQFQVKACNSVGCSGSITSPTWLITEPSVDAGEPYYLEDLRVRAVWTAEEGCYVLFRDRPSACNSQFSNAHALIPATDPNHEKLYSQAFMSAAIGKSVSVWFDDNGDCASESTLMTITQLEITD